MSAPVVSGDLVDRLFAHKLLGRAPREELAWLVPRGRLERIPVGEAVSRRGLPVDRIIFVLAGRIAHYIDRGAGPKKVMEWRTGDVTGMLPYSRMVTAPGDSMVEEACEVFWVSRDHLADIVRDCPQVTAILVHEMLDRARVFNSSDLHDDKMVSLGRLAAGLAHELNNPAAAAARSAKLLADALAEAESAAHRVGAMRLSDVHANALHRLGGQCAASPATSIRSPIARADREDEIAGWLEAHGMDTTAAAPLAETDVSVASLDSLANALPQEALGPALRWIAAGCTARALARDVENAAMRIHELVSAVKGFTYMDHASVPEPVDVGHGLADTLTMLAAKARAKSVAITLDVQPGLPPVRAFGGELNQVWANLIDNALDAVATSGHVAVSAAHEAGQVLVRVVDDGVGIPPDLQRRIFEPFFTTKPIGQGTGLGLDIVLRLVRRHNGLIDISSKPGRTEFVVRLPVDGDLHR